MGHAHHDGSIAEVKALLMGRIDGLVRRCAPDGKLEYGYWIARNPTRDDRHAGSFWIIVSRAGKTPGAWRDEATGDAGDILDLIAYTQRLSRGEAIKWAKDWLGYKSMAPTEIARASAIHARKVAEADALAARKLADDQERAAKMFRRAKVEKLVGSTADRYLASRGIDLRLLSRVPGAIGCLPRVRHAETETFWPVMVAQMSDARGRTLAVHRTFLALDGSGKAPVEPARKIWPSFRGLAIRLWRGETDLPADTAAERGLVDTLAIVEGVEDGLSLALARPDLRIWAAGTLGNLSHIVPPACAGDIIVCADNDWGKPQAEAQLKAAVQALLRTGRRVRVARSSVGKDLNDALRSDAGGLAA